MYKLCRINIKGSEKINAELITFVTKLKQRINIRSVYLHGSFARGDFNEGSDIDMVIVGDFKERFKDRITLILEMTDLPIEPLCYTEDEFKKMIANRNPFMLSVIENKTILYEKRE